MKLTVETKSEAICSPGSASPQQGSVLSSVGPFGHHQHSLEGGAHYSSAGGSRFLAECTCIDTEKGRERFLIVLFVPPFKEPALTSTASRTNPFSLTVALSAGGRAWGDLFWDDGDGLDTFETGNYSYLLFVAGEVWNTRQIFARRCGCSFA